MKKINSLYIIDDDKIYHFLFKKLLQQNNITAEATFFGNANDALEVLMHIEPEKIPDLILLDLNMPIINGWQFLEEFNKLKDSFAKIPTIYMITSSNERGDINKANDFKELVKDYFLKPICKEDLDKIFIVS